MPNIKDDFGVPIILGDRVHTRGRTGVVVEIVDIGDGFPEIVVEYDDPRKDTFIAQPVGNPTYVCAALEVCDA